MRNFIAFGILVTFVFAGLCNAEEYILKIEEIEGSAIPPIEHVVGMPTNSSGFLQVIEDDSNSIRISRCTELLVSTNARFHLKIKDRGNIVELDGRLQKSDGVSFSQVGVLTEPQQPPQRVTIEQGQDFLLTQVEYKCGREDGQRATMQSPSLPIRFGKKYCIVGGLCPIPPMLWSLEKANTESGK